jgi:transposase
MPFRKISRDVKIAAINLYDINIFTVEDLCHIVGFSQRTFWRIRRLWTDTGDVVTHKYGYQHGRTRILHIEDIQYLLRLIRHRPDWFLDELLDLLTHNRFISVHYSTIHRELIRCGVSLKKLKVIALERNEERRMQFIHKMSQYEPEELGFLHETSKNDKTPRRSHGRATQNHRAEMKQVFVRGRRLSATGLLTVDGVVASTIVEGSMTRVKYLEFLELQVVDARSSSSDTPTLLLLSRCLSALHIQVLLACLLWIMRQFTMAMRYWSWQIGLVRRQVPKALFLILILCQVSASSTYHHIHRTSTLSKKRSQKSRHSSAVTTTYSRLTRTMESYMTCMR